MECSSKFAIVSTQSRGDDMSRYGLVLAAILAVSPVSAANVTTWANATGWANLADKVTPASSSAISREFEMATRWV